MPRIPQGRFNKTPSTRVGAQKVTMPQQSGLDRAMKAAQNVTNAMAKLQDQRERTEAYNAANDIKRGYEEQKQRYLVSLENANADGSFEYADPFSEDPTKPEIIKGNVNAELKKLNDYYTKSQEGIQNLTRFDIASDLTERYVADDLVGLKLKTGKHIVRQGQKLQTENLLLNIETGFSKVLDLSTDSSNPELMNAKVTATLNQIDREIATVSQSIGSENSKKAKEFKERLLGKTASDLLDRGFTMYNVNAAQKLVDEIEDPLAKSNANFKLKSLRRTKSLETQQMVTEESQTMRNKIMSSDYVKPKDLLKAKEASKNLKMAYVDPEYSTITDQQKIEASLPLDSAILTKHIMQEQIDQTDDLKTIAELVELEQKIEDSKAQGRAPTAEDTQALTDYDAKITEFLDRSVASSGIKDMTENADYKLKLYDLAKKDLRKMYFGLKQSLPSIMANKYPSKDKKELYRMIDRQYQELKLGEVRVVPEESANAFRSAMKTAIRKTGTADAENLFYQMLDGAGQKYSRSVAIDATKGDEKLDYVVAAADYSAAGNTFIAESIIEDAKTVEAADYIPEATSKNLEESFNNYVDEDFAAYLPENKAMVGLKTAIFNKAKAFMVKERSDDHKKAMKEAVKFFKDSYVIRKSREGKDVISGINVKGGYDYTESVNKKYIDLGANKAVRMLPGLSLEQKKQIALDWLGLDEKVVAVATDRSLAEEFNNRLAIEPDARRMNVHVITYDGKPISGRDGKIIEYSMDNFVEFGKGLVEEGKKAQKEIEQDIEQGMNLPTPIGIDL